MSQLDPSAVALAPREDWGDAPHCLRCDRPVERVHVEYETIPAVQGDGFTAWFHTGRRTVTVECHGETWTESAYRAEWAGGFIKDDQAETP